jgi:hypothetical protein
MGFSTAILASTALAAALAGASTASAEPIRILNAGAQPRPAAPASDCAPAPAGTGGDIECVLSLTPPQNGAAPVAPSRIVIRAQWAPARCATRAAQVVDLTRPAARATDLPIVDQAGSGRACAS